MGVEDCFARKDSPIALTLSQITRFPDRTLTSLYESAVPRRFRQTSPTVLEIRDGGGIMTLLGLPFLLAGAPMVALFTRLLSLRPASDGKWTQPSCALTGLAFLILGTVFVFGRQWLTLDLSRGLVILQGGLLAPCERGSGA